MSKFDLFESIWEDVVEPTIKDFLSTDNSFEKYKKSSKEIAKKWFYNETHFFIYSYMVDETKNIDRHKIAACMLKAILVAKPIRISFFSKASKFLKKSEFDDNVYLRNQHIALNVAVLILEGYIRSDKNKNIKHSICIPEPFPKGQKDYFKDVCLDLYYTNPKQINTVTYANIFFLWEKYSCRKVQCNNLELELLSIKQFSESFKNLNLENKKEINTKLNDLESDERKYINEIRFYSSLKSDDTTV